MSLNEFKAKNGYEIEGYWLPRVTSITKVVLKPGLFRYYANQKNYLSAQNALNQAAHWGTLTHRAIANILRGAKQKIDERILPSLQAFYDWQSQNKVKILDPEGDIERTIFDFDELYAGTLDVLAEINGQLGILDIKTSAGIWDEYGLQLAAYVNGYNKNVPKARKAKKRWILRLDQFDECQVCGAKKRAKSGKPKIIGGQPDCYHQFTKTKGIFEFKELDNFKQDFKGFLGAKNLWEWSNRDWLRQINNYPLNRSVPLPGLPSPCRHCRNLE